MTKNTSEYNKEYYIKNRARIVERRAAIRKDPEHKKKVKIYHAEYHKKNPHKTRERIRRRRARIKGLVVERYTELQVLETYGTDCHICKLPINLNAPRAIGREDGWELGLHIDHLIPISSGGPDTLENVRPTHAKCNLDKGYKPPIQLAVQRKGE